MYLPKKLNLLLFALVLTANGMLAQEVSQREVIALLELHSRTNGHEWTHKWDMNKPISTWHGVEVKDGKVVVLDLSNNNLKGNLPLTVGNLTNLKYLDLSDNDLKGRMPRELRKFDDLKYLDLSGNHFKGKLPMTLNRMTDLVYLDFGANNFEGDLPSSITELSNLNSLVLADNNFSGGLPNGMENLKKLEKLYISKNKFDNLDNLRALSQQQLVLIDVDVNTEKFNLLDFTKTRKGMAELKFEDYEEQ